MDWNTFVYDNDAYIVKLVCNIPVYKIMLSNTVEMWTEELTVDQISERSKALNPLISADNETYLTTVLSIINNIPNEVAIHKTDDHLNLDCKTKLIGTPFKFTFNLKLSENKTFCTELTVPLIQTVQLLETRQNELLKVIEQNNEIIGQHVFENGQIKRVFDHVYKFNKNEFISSLPDTLCFNVLSKNDFKNRISEIHSGPPEILNPLARDDNKRNRGPSLLKQILRHHYPRD